MGQDRDTIQFYAEEWQAFTARRYEVPRAEIEHFMAAMPPGGRVLELGCGAGQESEIMLARGLDVLPTDGTPEIAAAASVRLGRPVPVLLFDQLCDEQEFDGIWANACLLHVPWGELSGVITRIHRALRPGGLFYASYKAGEGEGRDRFNRYFNYPTLAALRDLYARFEWQSVDMHEALGSGYDQVPTRWLHVFARAR